MTTASISQLKSNPAKVINAAADYPVAIQKRNDTAAYLVGRQLFEKMESFLEDYIDKKAIADADISAGEDFEKVAKKLGI